MRENTSTVLKNQYKRDGLTSKGPPDKKRGFRELSGEKELRKEVAISF